MSYVSKEELTKEYKRVLKNGFFDVIKGNEPIIEAVKEEVTMEEFPKFIESKFNKNPQGCCLVFSTVLAKRLHELGCKSWIVCTKEDTGIRASLLYYDVTGTPYVANPVEDIEFFTEQGVGNGFEDREHFFPYCDDATVKKNGIKRDSSRIPLDKFEEEFGQIWLLGDYYSEENAGKLFSEKSNEMMNNPLNVQEVYDKKKIGDFSFGPEETVIDGIDWDDEDSVCMNIPQYKDDGKNPYLAISDVFNKMSSRIKLKLRDDVDFAYDIYMQNELVYYYLPDEMKHNIEFAKRIVSKDGSSIIDLPADCIENDEVIIEAIKTYPSALKFSYSLDDENFVRKVIEIEPRAIIETNNMYRRIKKMGLEDLFISAIVDESFVSVLAEQTDAGLDWIEKISKTSKMAECLIRNNCRCTMDDDLYQDFKKRLTDEVERRCTVNANDNSERYTLLKRAVDYKIKEQKKSDMLYSYSELRALKEEQKNLTEQHKVIEEMLIAIEQEGNNQNID